MHLDWSFDVVVRPWWKYFRNLCCTGKQGVEQKGQDHRAWLYSFLLRFFSFFFFYLHKYANRGEQYGPIKSHWWWWWVFFFFFHDWGICFPLRWHQVSIINKVVMDWQVLGLKHDSVNRPVGWFLGLLIGSSIATVSGVRQFTGHSFVKHLNGAMLLIE